VRPREACFRSWRAFVLVTLVCGAAAHAQSVQYRVENLAFGIPGVYQNLRNYHEFVVDYAKCWFAFSTRRLSKARRRPPCRYAARTAVS
jgi:hypothetical protein